jgi:hypothetical protein
MFVRVEHAAAAAAILVGPLVNSDQLRVGGGGGGLWCGWGGRVGRMANWGAAKTEPPTTE